MREMIAIYNDGSTRSVQICTEPCELPMYLEENSMYDLKTKRAYTLENVVEFREEVQDELSKFSNLFI